MNAFDYILSRQVQWAHNNGIKLVGSRGDHGRLAYTQKLDDNLFQPLHPKVKAALERGAGGELNATNGSLPKMHAVHSSSALGLNMFQYWLSINEAPNIAAACDFCREDNRCSQNIDFEAQVPICDSFEKPPHIDVVIENVQESPCKVFAVECKFSEAYSSRRHSGIDPKYFDPHVSWEGIPHLHQFSKSISPDDTQFLHLHPAQLVKHILGLKKNYGNTGFRLLYLWYDALGEEGSLHRKEVEQFQEIAHKDDIKFHAKTYQELITTLADRYRSKHGEYIRYITSRYL